MTAANAYVVLEDSSGDAEKVRGVYLGFDAAKDVAIGIASTIRHTGYVFIETWSGASRIGRVKVEPTEDSK